VRYFFNIKDGVTFLDQTGVECADLNELRNEAVGTSAKMLKGLKGEHFWTGEAWTLWVTDQPKGQGNTVLSLTFIAAREKPGLVIDVVLPKKIDGEPELGTKH
jgi:hypothetical protein